jgi:hypothetical protein
MQPERSPLTSSLGQIKIKIIIKAWGKLKLKLRAGLVVQMAHRA